MADVTGLNRELAEPDYPLLHMGVLLRGRQLMHSLAAGDIQADPRVIAELEKTVQAAALTQY